MAGEFVIQTWRKCGREDKGLAIEDGVARDLVVVNVSFVKNVKDLFEFFEMTLCQQTISFIEDEKLDLAKPGYQAFA